VPSGIRVPVLGNTLAVHHLSNTGGALGFQAGRPVLVIGLAVVSVSLLLLLFWFLPVGRHNRLLATTLAIGGGIGNLIDRIRVRGVVDFLEITIGGTVLPVFNVADVAVMVGAIWLAWSIWWDERNATASSA
jgi:signal peptidase II